MTIEAEPERNVHMDHVDSVDGNYTNGLFLSQYLDLLMWELVLLENKLLRN